MSFGDTLADETGRRIEDETEETIQTEQLVAPPDNIAMMEPFIEEYNSTNRILRMLLLLMDFQGVFIFDPSSYAVDMMEELYQQEIISLIEAHHGLMQVMAGESYPHYQTKVMVQVNEEYLLTVVEPDSYIPLSVLDPQAMFPFKYRRIRLYYVATEDLPGAEFPMYWPGNPYEGLLIPPYPEEHVDSWPYPAIPGDTSFTNIWLGTGASQPATHWRYSILPEWLYLLQHDAGHVDYWMQEDVFDCFIQPFPEDPDYVPLYNPFKSRGIKSGGTMDDDYYQTYLELVDRGYAPNAYRRGVDWLEMNAVWTYSYGSTYIRIFHWVMDSPVGGVHSPYVGWGAPGLIPLALVGLQGAESIIKLFDTFGIRLVEREE